MKETKETKSFSKSRRAKKKRNNIQSQDQKLGHEAHDRFNKYLEKRRVAMLKQKLHDYYGKNFVIKYQKRFNFEQEWEQQQTAATNNISQNILEENFIEIGSSLFIAVIFTLNIWIGTVDLIFRKPSQVEYFSGRTFYETLYIMAICTTILDLSLKIKKKIGNHSIEFSFQSIGKTCYKELYCIITFFAKLQFGQANVNAVWIIFQIIAIAILYHRASYFYKSLRLVSFSLYYEYHSKICDLVITLFTILHLTAIVLFLSTLTEYTNNWVNQKGLSHQNQFIIYIYSFYYASTTVLTVGYGDISPKNPVQVVVIVFVQIVGMATLGYIINQIGYCISNLRKQRQTMEKDLSIVLKLKKHYGMDEKLTQQARSFIVNNRQKADQLYPAEQNMLLQKFNEDLRSNVHQANLSAVIKSSIFFLTRWSKNFRNVVASRLEHTLLSPNDLIYQPSQKERVYIIKSGKIYVYADKGGRKKGINNLLKTIDLEKNKTISDNCYGYTAVISSRPSRLYAKAKELTSAYFIDKESFLECLSQRVSDSQFYHEIKDRMDQSQHWEAFEAPLIESSKNHYNPTKQKIIRTYLRDFTDENNDRVFLKRKLPRPKFKKLGSNEQISDIEKRFEFDSKRQLSTSISDPNNFEVNWKKNDNFLDTIREEALNESQSIASKNANYNSNKYLHHFFELSKEYTNYFPRNNQVQVLRKIDRQNFIYTYTAQQKSIITLQLASSGTRKRTNF